MDSFKWTLCFVCLCLKVTQTEASSWTIKVPSSIEGLLGSCVVIPCSYNFPDPAKKVTQFTGMWEIFEDKNHLIYHPVKSKIMQQYQNRTELLGDVKQKSCSLKIDPLEPSDKGPFYFRIEIADYDNFSYERNTIFIRMISELRPINFSVTEAIKGQAVSASCSVSHTCPTSPPVFTWSHSGHAKSHSQQLEDGLWRTTSILTFHPTRADLNKALQCTVTYKGGRDQTASKVLKLKCELRPINFSVTEAIKGQAVSASCSVSHTCPTSPPVFTWSHSGHAKSHSQQLEDGLWRTTSILTFHPTRADLNKALQCTVTYKGGRDQTASKVLKLKYAPVNVKVEYKSDVTEGEAVQLKCSSDAHPPASDYEWHDEAGSQLYQGKVFMLPNVSRHHTGAFYCTAINSVGQGKSSPVHLNVLYAPEVKTVSSCSPKAKMIECVCIVESRPPSSVHFMLSGRVLQSTKVEKHDSVTIGTLQAELGSYEFVLCLANNTQGNANLTLFLPVNSEMQNLYIIITSGVGVILLILLIAVGVVKKWERSGDQPTSLTSSMGADKDLEHPHHAATKRQEKTHDDVNCPSIYVNYRAVGNMEADWDDAIYSNM